MNSFDDYLDKQCAILVELHGPMMMNKKWTMSSKYREHIKAMAQRLALHYVKRAHVFATVRTPKPPRHIEYKDFELAWHTLEQDMTL